MTHATPSVSIRGRFLRSVNLVRDFYDRRGHGGYIVTARARDVLTRLADALNADEAQRAWSIVGPYGGGKSAFALFAAHLARGRDGALAKLRAADTALADRLAGAFAAPYCPVLIVGKREPLSRALAQGLARALTRFADEAPADAPAGDVQAVRALARAADTAAEAQANDGNRVVTLYQQAAAAVERLTGGGLFVVVDELGKLLEYEALHPADTDLFVLQRLAERAARTGDTPEDAAPLLLLTIQHQAFERYAGRLSTEQREEWRKIQGRFADVGYVEPVDETLRLLAHAVEGDAADGPPDAADLVDRVLAAADLPERYDHEAVRTHLADALPLHPAVSLLVGPLFRRLAQNERSLFAFLASGEPGSFTDVMGGHTGAPPATYRLDHLYDYLVATLGATLFHESMNRLWAETEAALSRLDAADERAVRLLKQVALLNFAGDLAGLRPTEALLAAALDAPRDDVAAILATLRDARVVSYRAFRGEYHVWRGSDFQLDERLKKARQHVSSRVPLASLLNDVVPPTPVVARRHSYRTGTTRVFEVVYASDATWPALTETPSEEADGRLVYVLPGVEGQADALVQHLKEVTAQDDAAHPLTLFAVPRGVRAVREAARDLARLDWVRAHSPELDGDEAARKEVDMQRADLDRFVRRRVSNLLVADETGANPCTWVYGGAEIAIDDERDVQRTLTKICDRVFRDTPEVWNELLNRRNPSSSAKRGLKLLLEAMVTTPHVERLGMEGHPAEYGMYASILQKTGMHRERDAGTWTFAPPDAEKHPGCRAVWDAVDASFDGAEGGRVSVQALYDMLAAPPYSVRDGLIPVFLFAYIGHAADDMALYEDGSFAMDVSYERIGRLLKTPSKFTLQRVRLDGPRAEVLRQLAPSVGLPETTRRPLPFVKRLLQHVRGLPPYVRRTTHLDDSTINVREKLHRALEPTTLLFEELPEAVGHDSFLKEREEDFEPDRVAAFIADLQDALRELAGAYDGLVERIEAEIADVFDLRALDVEERRHVLAERARVLLPHASDTMLKAFLVRATDEMLDTQGWYESLAALACARSTARASRADLAC